MENFKTYSTNKTTFSNHPGVQATNSDRFENICDLCESSQFIQKVSLKVFPQNITIIIASFQDIFTL